MTNPVAARRQFLTSDDRKIGARIFLWCPACEELHTPAVVGEDGDRPDGPCWEWNGDLENLTIDPSILIRGGRRDTHCHSFVRDGHWEFLGDCNHELAGQKVALVPLPDWVVKDA